jgi:hypothetical protein
VGTKPQQAGGQDAADLAQVRGEMEIQITVMLSGSGVSHRVRGIDHPPSAI